MPQPTQVQVRFDYDDGSNIVVPVGPPVYTPGGTQPPQPPGGLVPSLPANLVSRLNPTPAFDEQFASAPQWGKLWANTWFGGNNFNGMPLDPNNIQFQSGGGVKLNVSNGGRTGCMMNTNPGNQSGMTGFQFGYGYDETDAIVISPSAWPAIWNNGQTWPQNGEDDIVEILGGANFTTNHHDGGPNHSGNDQGQNSGTLPGSPGAWAGRRVKYGSIRLPDNGGTTQTYYDGQLQHTFKVYDQGAPHYLILTIGDKNNGGAGPLTVFRRTVWLLAS